MTITRLCTILLLALLNSCAVVTYMTPHPITVYSLDGEVLKGEYSFSGRMKGTVRVTRLQDGEIFTGDFTSVDDTTFSTAYARVFGTAYGRAYGPAGAATGSAYGSATGNSWTRTTGGRFHGIGVLTEKDTVMLFTMRSRSLM